MPTSTATYSTTTTTATPSARSSRDHHRSANSTHHRAPSASRPVHTRHRSASDPFLDIYSPPRVPYAEQPRQTRSNTVTHSPLPPVPPKSSRKPRQYPDHRDPRMLEAAVRDTVTVRPSTADHVPRTRMGRSMTSAPSGNQVRPPPATSRRSYSQDSVTQVAAAVEKARTAKNSKANAGSKKGSAHADVIDSLDPSSYGGPMFHHDGPFDACAPSRNKHKNKAPMLAWANRKEDREPTSAANFREQRRLASIDNNPANNRYPTANSDSPYGAVSAFAADMADYPNKNQVDRIAEAWGMHEPEPYEEFFGGGGGGGGGGNESAASSVRGGMEGRDGRYRRRDFRQDHADDALPPSGGGRPIQTRRPTNRGNIPPPQPIFAPEDAAPVSASLPSPGATGLPKRSKSIMQKFRRLREAPNVPMGGGPAADYDDDRDGSPPSSLENYQQDGNGVLSDGGRAGRPTHRHQNSFFGRFGRGGNNPGSKSADEYSPTQDQFAHVDKVGANRGKDLPPRPQGITPAADPYNEKDDYFNTPVSPGSPTTPGNGLGRKTSLLKKVKGVVRATNK